MNSTNNTTTPKRSLTNANTNLVVTPTSAALKAGERKILLNGNGLGGILVGVLFFVIGMSGFYAIMNLFVNTKLLTTPLLLGKVEY